MNERINDIKHLCYIPNSQDVYDMDKFAELLVRECVKVARQADIDGCNIGNYAWEKIEQHFGVEE